MTELILVRHGQAGATPEAYDQLSPLGREQALRLGRWLLAHGRDFAVSASGRMRRQRETLGAVAEIYAQDGRELPAAEILSGLDEYSFVEVVRAFASKYPDHPDVSVVRDQAKDKRLWLSLLRTALSAWMTGDLESVSEGFVSFRERTGAALQQLTERLARGPVLAVSSGGVMGQVAQHLLGFPDSTLIDINFSLMNTAICEYRLTRSGLKLVSLNTLPHLSAPDDRSLLTVV